MYYSIFTRSAHLTAQPYKLIYRNILSISIAFSPKYWDSFPLTDYRRNASWNKRSYAVT